MTYPPNSDPPPRPGLYPDRPSLADDDHDDTSTFETCDPSALTPDQKARLKAYRRRQKRDREAVNAVIKAVKRFGWRVLAALSLPIAIEIIRIVLDWAAHRQ